MRAEIVTVLRSVGEPMTATQIADTIGCDRGTVHHHINTLEARGVVRTSRLRTGRRGKPPRLVELLDPEDLPLPDPESNE